MYIFCFTVKVFKTCYFIFPNNRIFKYRWKRLNMKRFFSNSRTHKANASMYHAFVLI